MQYIISEEEYEIFRRCKRAIEQDYKFFTEHYDNGERRISEFTIERLMWALCMRDTFPNVKEMQTK